MRFVTPLLRAAPLLAACLAVSASAQAQSFETQVEYTFGQQITYALTAPGALAITDATLLVRPGAADTEVAAAERTHGPGDATRFAVMRDLSQRPYAPFARVEYWWRITTDSGEQIETEHRAFVYEDNRFDWQVTERGAIELHWHAGDLSFGQAAADIASNVLEEIAADLDAPLPNRLSIYVYASGADLRDGLRLGGRDWVGGHANPKLGVVLAAAAPGPEQLLTLRRVLPHELTHVLLYQLLQHDYDRIPGWLNEGLAVVHEGDRNPVFAQALQAAAENERLLTFKSLCRSFPLEGDQAVLAYAQSGSLVSYLYESRGASAINGLLLAYRDGAGCEGGVQLALHTDLSGLQAEWESNALNVSPLKSALRRYWPILALGILMAVILAWPALPPGRKRPAAHG